MPAAFHHPRDIRIIGGELLIWMRSLSDRIIAVHTPLTEKRAHDQFRDDLAHEDGVYLVCTRGGIIDESALLSALNSGKVAGAALDVFENEPPQNLELIKHPRVIATPHIAGQTSEAQRRASVDISKEILAALKNEKLHWQVV